ncbi:hypothetical protein B0T19DRAFT_286852 [Cercophora scortea]|uniref:Uncharacterized protein n=1 Tax=Cercophora scortea TaxID=314031 RepID=A0AAE0I2B3_9PEZI|nr:hypothetical protein B0T19DRAFT_286852 [Cercophora scortea]
MAIIDIPPAHCPPWLVLANSALIAVGVLLWDATYILMTRRALATKSYGMPLLALAINVSWEIVYLVFVIDTALETAGFMFWLVLDGGLVYTTVRFGPDDWRTSSPWVGRHLGGLLALMVTFGCLGHYAFAAWWLAEPGRGAGDKTGKWWQGQDRFDTSEMAFWSAAVSQLVLSAGSVAMLLVRGHSGGTGFVIWLCRVIGSMCGMLLGNLLMWWYWPEANSFIVNPFAVFLLGTALACDLIYPFLLWQIRRTEVVGPDGRLSSGRQLEPDANSSPEPSKQAKTKRP